MLGLEQRGIARTSRRQNGNPERDAPSFLRHATTSRSAAKDDGKLPPPRQQLQLDDLDDELVLFQLEPIEIADNTCGHAAGLEKFTRQLLHVFSRHTLEQRDQLGRSEVAIKINVIPRQIVHALAGALERQQRRAFQMILGASQFLRRDRFVL
jgi:hypothetical protein